VAGFFGGLKDDAGDVAKNAQGASWQAKNWPQAANGELVSALDGNWGQVEKVIDKKLKDKAAAAGQPVSGEADRTRDPRFSACHHDDPRIPHARSSARQSRPARHCAKLEDYNELSPENYGFTEADYDRPIFIDKVLGLGDYATVREMLDILQRTYCSTLGVEFMHISDPEEKAWIQERIEGPDKAIEFTPNGKKAILQKLIEAEGFEQFIDVKYKGTKRFGLDGGESLIPALEQIIKRGGALGLKEIVLGMAHRGRFNVLTNVMAKPHRAVFHEFKGGSYAPDDVEGSGDVKYHLGASSDREFDSNKVHLSLTANPSHLEIVDPVVMGKARAKQDQLFGRTREEIVPLEERAKVMPLLLHGDAAFAGQGVIAEMPRSVGAARPPRGGHGAFHHQQPDRLHHQSAVLALVALSVRCGEDDRSADLPRQRRRSRSRRLRSQGCDRIPDEVPQAGGRRYVLLSPLRPQ
jgi:2-oxoglutarate dehydrogenase E1 component